MQSIPLPHNQPSVFPFIPFPVIPCLFCSSVLPSLHQFMTILFIWSIQTSPSLCSPNLTSSSVPPAVLSSLVGMVLQLLSIHVCAAVCVFELNVYPTCKCWPCKLINYSIRSLPFWPRKLEREREKGRERRMEECNRPNNGRQTEKHRQIEIEEQASIPLVASGDVTLLWVWRQDHQLTQH